MNSCFRYDVGVETVAEVDGIDVVTARVVSACAPDRVNCGPYHSKSLYMMVKKTCKKRLTAFMRTASRYNHASPDILTARPTAAHAPTSRSALEGDCKEELVQVFFALLKRVAIRKSRWPIMSRWWKYVRLSSLACVDRCPSQAGMGRWAWNTARTGNLCPKRFSIDTKSETAIGSEG